MNLETAKKLAWPWVTKFVYEAGNLILKSFSSPKYQPCVPCPSIEEMLERMPKKIKYKGEECYLSFSWRHGGLSVGYEGFGIVERGTHDDFYGWQSFIQFDGPLEDTLPTLCIWLRDNKLMEGWKDE